MRYRPLPPRQQPPHPKLRTNIAYILHLRPQDRKKQSIQKKVCTYKPSDHLSLIEYPIDSVWLAGVRCRYSIDLSVLAADSREAAPRGQIPFAATVATLSQGQIPLSCFDVGTWAGDLIFQSRVLGAVPFWFSGAFGKSLMTRRHHGRRRRQCLGFEKAQRTTRFRQ